MADQPPKAKALAIEDGWSGLNITSGRIYEESRTALVFPQSLFTYDQMAQNVAIASALNAQFVIASRAPFYIEPFNQTDYHKNLATFLEECIHDMEHSFYDYIREALSFIRCGFSLNEIVLRERRPENGSKFKDGKWGIRCLPSRSQASVYKWNYDETGRKLVSFTQKVKVSSDSISASKEITIPMWKLLHHKVDPYKGNPEGVSPLNACYHAWRMLQKLHDTELIATAKNLNGIPVFSIPAEYMTDDATDGQKQTYNKIKEMGKNTNNGELAVAVLPSDRDDNGNKIFDFDIVNSSASNISALNPIVQRYTNEIFQALFADVLQMGTDKGGNYNVVDSKATMLEIIVEARLREICEVFNTKLVTVLWELNGWDKTKTPKIRFGDLSRPNLETWAKAVQQLSATNNLPKTPTVINKVLEMLDIDYRVADNLTKAELDELLGVNDKMQSRSGDGLNKKGNGTSDEVSPLDESADNLSNK